MVLPGVAGTGSRWSVRRRTVALGTLLVLLLAGTLVLQVADRARASADRCETYSAESRQRAAEVTGSGQRVVVIGDSWSAGLGLERLSGSWPSRLDGAVHVAGFSGSGFSARASGCRRVSFAERAPAALRAGADLVVVEGGLNDYDQPDADIRAGFARLMHQLDGQRVVVVGPATAPSRAAQVPRVDALLAELAAQQGVPYVRTSGLKLSYLDDRLHLTAEGHAAFGDFVSDAIRGLGS
ncbi:SGNH/GDSL hydrolase family protein [Nocardioides pyridinolyticus]